MTALTSGPSPTRRAVLAQRIRWFVAATIVYNVIEAVVALAAGTSASSSALIGFGLDSVIEVSSAAAVAWQFAGTDPEAREKVALRCIAFSFFALAAFVTVTALRSLFAPLADAADLRVIFPVAISNAASRVVPWRTLSWVRCSGCPGCSSSTFRFRSPVSEAGSKQRHGQ